MKKIIVVLSVLLLAAACNKPVVKNESVTEPAKQETTESNTTTPIVESATVATTSSSTLVSEPVVTPKTPAIVKTVPKATPVKTVELQAPTPTPVVQEENFSDLAVKLYSAQLEILQTSIDTVAQAKDVYAGIKQTWNDELIKTNVYLRSYPDDPDLIRDAKVYQLLMDLSDNGVALIDQATKPALGVKTLLQQDIAKYKAQKVSQSEMQAIFTDLDSAAKFNQLYSDKLKKLYNDYSTQNHNVAVTMDALHQVAATQKQQQIDQLTQLQQQANALVANTQATLDRIQADINASRTVYCNATRTGVGSVSVVCQ